MSELHVLLRERVVDVGALRVLETLERERKWPVLCIVDVESDALLMGTECAAVRRRAMTGFASTQHDGVGPSLRPYVNSHRTLAGCCGTEEQALNQRAVSSVEQNADGMRKADSEIEEAASDRGGMHRRSGAIRVLAYLLRGWIAGPAHGNSCAIAVQGEGARHGASGIRDATEPRASLSRLMK